MTYSYQCESCGKVTEIVCSISEMKREIICSCSGIAKKIIEAPMLVGVSSSIQKINREMKKRNEDAGKRMPHSHKSLKPTKSKK